MTNNSAKTQWQYLEHRPHPWRQQLYIKGKRIKASVIYSDMIVNNETPAEAAENWDLPLAAISQSEALRDRGSYRILSKLPRAT